MVANLLNRLRSWWFFIATFFPIQLFLLHLRRSHILMIFWLLLFAFSGGFIAQNYGIHYLFLTPEYLDQVNFFSYLLVGLTLGLFVMAFHISSYIYYSYRYPFLATLNRPLWKFSLNNSVIPLLFYGYYGYHIIDLLISENFSAFSIISNMLGLLLGSLLMISLSFYYFTKTLRTPESNNHNEREKSGLMPFKKLSKAEQSWYQNKKSRVNYYLRSPFSVNLTRGAEHYKDKLLLDTMQQHHFSAAIYFLVLIILVITLGLVQNTRFFLIPAGAIVFLIFSLYLMITGAFYSRLKTWTLTAGVIALLGLNYFSGSPRFKSINYAFGLNYETEKASYSQGDFENQYNDSILQRDTNNLQAMLGNWKSKQSVAKPKLVLLNLSGGGQRSALWTYRVLSELSADKAMGFYPNVFMMSGSSGGMLGAAFFRELFYQNVSGNKAIPWKGDTAINSLGRDMLNPVTFSLAVNDLFFRLKKVRYHTYTYPMDRGYAFDQRLKENSFGLLDKRVMDYANLEQKAEVPWLVLSPTIVGDGRKLLMSTQGCSFFTFSENKRVAEKQIEFNSLEFFRFFEKQDSENLSYLTALRLSASFPYITPLVTLPSNPPIQLIDAGVRDNDGFELSVRTILAMEKWIKENTSGVVIVQIKANRPDEVEATTKRVSKLDKLMLPVSGIWKSFHNLQVYNKSVLMDLADESFDFPVEVVRFSLLKEKGDVSLSWHLTNQEKANVKKAFYDPYNQAALARLREIME